YIPVGLTLTQAAELRTTRPDEYVKRSLVSMVKQVEAMLAFQADGAVVFEYGNYIRGHAREAGLSTAFNIQGFVPKYMRPSFCQGRGPFRWVCLSGNIDDLRATDEAVLNAFPHDTLLQTWIKFAM